MTLTGSGDVTVVLTGAVLKDSESVYRVDYAERGEVQTVENELITSTERAHAVGNWTKDYLCNRKTLTSDSVSYTHLMCIRDRVPGAARALSAEI